MATDATGKDHALPHNGGEKNYLEFLFPRPRRLITSIYAANAVLLAYAAGNSLVFAEYALKAVAPHLLDAPSPPPGKAVSWLTPSPVRLVAFSCLSGAMLLHGLHVSAGLRLQNVLGISKIGILCVVVATGAVAATGRLAEGVEHPDNFDSWSKIWEGSRWGGSVINANYALSEMRRPERTLRIAGPIAIGVVTVFYLAANLAYFSAASKDAITGSGRLVAALLFKNVWGPRTERILSGFVALSALGNVLSVISNSGPVILAGSSEPIIGERRNPVLQQGLGFGMAKKGSSGGAGATIVVFALPAGDAYNFVLNVISYPLAVINCVISFGLVWTLLPATYTSGVTRKIASHSTILASFLSAPPSDPDPQPSNDVVFPRPTPSLVLSALFFGFANVFLFVLPFFKPPNGAEPYQHLPYWTHAAGGWSVFLVGFAWWYFQTRNYTS
ncbi:high affinity methionine permease [Coprinopsis cinerea okayama7|uniref:High affinity methionine permease n=1 Tax=Coprinopsis cinerea (strain Okayama-7 / 130 / ATCC MYA-4618 / FGSC 9003) TaxID=240176 RepID=A8NVV3_COPC7|nr:high affinity methionine permease [Coprinopsis cinerea okayama7\|eukprot:XP_001836761.2 high affinity methionine permease [Coprinopsis cinerea okayama7\